MCSYVTFYFNITMLEYMYHAIWYTSFFSKVNLFDGYFLSCLLHLGVLNYNWLAHVCIFWTSILFVKSKDY